MNSIPFVAIDRIEVLLDGASAIYGSDAIAGVVNVILKKDFQGTYAMATGGTTTKGGGTTWNAQLMQGFGDINSGLGGWVAGEFRKQDPIRLNQRQGEPWAITDYTPYGGINLNPGARNAAVPNPVIRNAPYLVNPTGGAARVSQQQLRPRETERKPVSVRRRLEPDPAAAQNINLIGNLTAKIPNSDWQLSLTGSYFVQESEQVWRPGTITFSAYGGALTAGPSQNVKVGVNAIPVFRVPASYPGNPFGVPANIRAFSPIDAGTSRPARTLLQADSWRKRRARRGAGTRTSRPVTPMLGRS